MKYRILEQYSEEEKRVMFYPQYCDSWIDYLPWSWLLFTGRRCFLTKKEAEQFIEDRIPKIHEFPGAYYQRPWPAIKKPVKEEPLQEYGEG